MIDALAQLLEPLVTNALDALFVLAAFVAYQLYRDYKRDADAAHRHELHIDEIQNEAARIETEVREKQNELQLALAQSSEVTIKTLMADNTRLRQLQQDTDRRLGEATAEIEMLKEQRLRDRDRIAELERQTLEQQEQIAELKQTLALLMNEGDQ